MEISSQRNKLSRIAGRLSRLLVVAAVLAVILQSVPVLSQKDREGLVLTILPSNFSNKVKVGEDNRLFLEVRNNSWKEISQIRLSSEQPAGWLVEFNPDEISSLDARGVQSVDLVVRTDSRATKGNYQVTVIAQANETRSVIEVFLTIETSASLWIWIGASIGVVLIGVFVFIFVRSGREKT